MSPERRRRRLIAETRVLLILAYIVIVFSYVCPFPLRHESGAVTVIMLTAFMIRVFLFHLGVGIAGLLIISLAMRQWKTAAAAVPLVLFIMLPECRNPFAWKNPGVPGTLKVCTLNLFEYNSHADQALSVIDKLNPDLLVLQEYTSDWHSRIGDQLNRSYPHRRIDPQPDPYASAIYSRIALKGEQKPQFITLGRDAPPQMKTTAQFLSTDVSLYHIHLLTPSGVEQFREQCRQVADLVDAVMQETGPVVCAGDFNFNERTQPAAALRKCGLQNAYDRAGRLRGSTWPSVTFLRFFPGIRLDHILVKGLDPVFAQTGPSFGSDHRPVYAEMSIDLK